MFPSCNHLLVHRLEFKTRFYTHFITIKNKKLMYFNLINHNETVLWVGISDGYHSILKDRPGGGFVIAFVNVKEYHLCFPWTIIHDNEVHI
jgi:hypothetical protein